MDTNDSMLWIMMLVPSGICIALGIILQVAAATRKKRVAIGPVLIAAGVIFAIVGIVTVLSLR